MPEFRTVERYNLQTQGWESCEFEDLRPGDVMRLFEPDGTPVLNNLGGRINRVTSTPARGGDAGNWQVVAEPTDG